jgi:hypothetical protein
VIGPLALSLALLAAPDPALCAAPRVEGATCRPSGDDDALRARIAPLLGAIDRPVPADAWRRLPPGALRALEEMASDPAAFALHRARALEGAALLGSDGGVHRRLANDPATPFAVRASAIRGLAAISSSDPALGALLASDPDRRVRATAADALARTAPDRACAAVRAQAAREGTDGRGAFRHALASCGLR